MGQRGSQGGPGARIGGAAREEKGGEEGNCLQLNKIFFKSSIYRLEQGRGREARWHPAARVKAGGERRDGTCQESENKKRKSLEKKKWRVQAGARQRER